MKPSDLINPWSGNQSRRKHCSLWCSLVAGVILIAGGCERHNGAPRPAWAEEYHPDYDVVRSAYNELASFVIIVMEEAGTPITTFDELGKKLGKMAPELQVALEGENPFPSLLPKHPYERLSTWGSITNTEKLPLIWTTVRLREPGVLYITGSGAIHVEKPEQFQILLHGFLSRGAKLWSTNSAVSD